MFAHWTQRCRGKITLSGVRGQSLLSQIHSEQNFVLPSTTHGKDLNRISIHDLPNPFQIFSTLDSNKCNVVYFFTSQEFFSGYFGQTSMGLHLHVSPWIRHGRQRKRDDQSEASRRTTTPPGAATSRRRCLSLSGGVQSQDGGVKARARHASSSASDAVTAQPAQTPPR